MLSYPTSVPMARVRVEVTTTILLLCYIYSINPLVFVEIVGFGGSLVLAFSIAVVMSIGRAYTCDRVTKDPKFNT